MIQSEIQLTKPVERLLYFVKSSKILINNLNKIE